MNDTLFGKKVFADVIKDLEAIIPSYPRGPEFNDKLPL